MTTLEKAIKLRQHMTGKGADTFETASLKDKWISLAEQVEFKVIPPYKKFPLCQHHDCILGSIEYSPYCLWHSA